MTKGALLKVTGLTKEAEMNAIKEFFSKFEKVAWVDQEDDHVSIAGENHSSGVLTTLEHNCHSLNGSSILYSVCYHKTKDAVKL